MKTLRDLATILTIEEFNDLVMTWLAGDEEYIHDSLDYSEEITPPNQNYLEKLAKEHGYTPENFPYHEFREYCDKVQEYLKHQYILKPQEKLLDDAIAEMPINFPHDDLYQQLLQKSIEIRHKPAVKIIIKGLVNQARRHWIDEELAVAGEPSVDTIFQFYNIQCP